MSKTVGYLRVSTDAQSVDSQKHVLEKAGVETFYADKGVSGKTPTLQRPGFREMLAVLQPGDVLTVYSLARLGRSTIDVIQTVEALVAKGIIVRSATEPIDTSSPIGRAFLSILAAFAQLERETIVERVNAGVRAAKARGVKFGRPASVTGEMVAEARQSSVAVVATKYGVGASTLRRAVAQAKKGT